MAAMFFQDTSDNVMAYSQVTARMRQLRSKVRKVHKVRRRHVARRIKATEVREGSPVKRQSK